MADERWSAPVEDMVTFDQACWSGIERCSSGQTWPGIVAYVPIDSLLCRVGRVGPEGCSVCGLSVLCRMGHIHRFESSRLCRSSFMRNHGSGMRPVCVRSGVHAGKSTWDPFIALPPLHRVRGGSRRNWFRVTPVHEKPGGVLQCTQQHRTGSTHGSLGGWIIPWRRLGRVLVIGTHY